VRTLRELGVTLVDAQPLVVPQLNARILFCLGPDGERIELFEYQSVGPDEKTGREA
jgi:hypothetical protein